ncbi:protease inhibitor I42 family protein [Carboxylicivirga linearis]|uniref:Protease inhibitor I42 family protein n=1 Tax=Carboxylicivirga linearis TaxID=1628157 RepID=A0ABS5K0N4_9BACT|nr:protease inhibitor I42 family protein [Carboxylicivirga linearis]MBS2100625.1 protease inhibitor I42 family protein [Carboxylicivirga linearis]
MKNLFLTVFVLLFVLSSCKTTEKNVLSSTQQDYNIDLGDEFTISLKSNSTTGYSWQWVNKQSVEAVDSVDWRYTTLNTNLIGAGGTEKWSFKGIKSGVDTLKMIYSRPWEAESAVDSVYVIVKVQ